MGHLEVCSDGLETFAAQCIATSGRLATQVPTGGQGPATQATSAAVATAYSTIKATAAVLAYRVQETSSRLIISTARFATTETEAAHRLAALDSST